MCPGTSKVARLERIEGTKIHLTKLFFASIFPIHIFFFHFYRSYHFPTFSFLKPQPIRAIIVKCDGSVYHIDVDNQIVKVQRTADRWTCSRWRNTSSVGAMLDEFERPSLEARRAQSSFLLSIR